MEKIITLFNFINNNSGVICTFLLVVILIYMKCNHKKTMNEIKFLFRRSEIAEMKESSRNIPENLKSDYFSKQEGESDEG